MSKYQTTLRPNSVLSDILRYLNRYIVHNCYQLSSNLRRYFILTIAAI